MLSIVSTRAGVLAPNVPVVVLLTTAVVRGWPSLCKNAEVA
jgi:hypothetical protein